MQALQTAETLDKIETAIQTLLFLIKQGLPLQLAFSGGKDSTCCAILFFEAVRRAHLEGVKQPTHTVGSSSTGTDSPAMENHLLDMHELMEQFCMDQNLPIQIKLVEPTLAASFVVSTIGRGTLPRFPENGKARQCAVAWKLQPQQRLSKAIREAAALAGYGEPISIIGTRRSESHVRSAKMADRRESAIHPVRSESGTLVLSPIADWELEDVWDLLSLFMESGSALFPSFAQPDAMFRLFELYRDANDGVCGVLLGDAGEKKPCASRFGCWNCCITGAADRSMESMLTEEQHQYMRGLNDFRNLLVATQHDMSRRELIGRSVSPAGYIPVRPDVYSYRFRRNLLAYLITLDRLEEERAESLVADINTGRAEPTPLNRKMASPQFQHVSFAKLALVDFFWSMHPYAEHAFPALSLWYEITQLGRRYTMPKIERSPKVSIPECRWYKIGSYDSDVPVDGLRDYVGELWGPYLHPDRPFHHRQIGKERTVWFDEAENLEVDREKACEFISCTFPTMFIDSRYHHSIESARFWLDQEIVKLPKGMAARYQEIAKRGQYFASLQQKLNVTPAELDQHLVSHSITTEDHERLLAHIADAPRPQGELVFGSLESPDPGLVKEAELVNLIL